ncbi:MAG: amidohydrolase family protein, partial [Betaproteobacteria bacterium]|nr:amidohydrolase family protein [Betaproteobacteria bacterium]
MFIADAQVHIWGANTPERPWPARHQPHRAVPLGKDELLREMDAAGVDRVIIVPPSWEGERNDLALASARAHPDRFAVMGRLDTEASGARECIKSWRQQPGMLGLRFTFHRPNLMAPLTEGRTDWLWSEAERAGVPIMVLVSHPMVHLIDRVAERHPALKLVMDHLGLTSGKDEEAFRDLDKLLEIARRPNVAVKASALPCFTNDVYPYRRLHPYLRRVYDDLDPGACSGAPISRGCRAPIARASPCSRRRCRGLRPRTGPGSWAAACANGSGGDCLNAVTRRINGKA